MKKLLILAFITIVTHAHANDVFVSPSGTGTTCSTGSPCSVATGVGQVTSPGIVHFKDGTYPNMTISKGGSSQSSRIVYQCDNGITNAFAALGHCKFTGSGIVITGAGGANNYDLRGFDIGSNGDMQVGYDGLYCGSGTQSTCNNSVHIIGNYIHDFAQNMPVDSNGCILLGFSPGAILILNQHNHFVTDTQVIGNFITRAGPLPKGQCNTGTNGMYIDTSGAILQNNLIVQVHNWGMQVFGIDCDQRIANNTVITAHFGMNTTGGGESVCTSGHNTIDNQIIMNTLSNKIWGTIGCDSSHPNLVGHVITDGIGADFDRTQQACTSIIPNPLVHASGSSVFVNYQTNGTGDYHLKAGSPAIGEGWSTCTSGGATPCIPPTDIAGTVRPSGGVQDAGAYVFSSTGVPVVAFSPSPLAYGSVAVSTSSTLSATLTNTGTVNLTFSAATISGTNASDFSILSTTCASPLAAGVGCSYSLRFTPSATGARSASLTLNDNAAGSPHQLPLTGTGGASAITVNPTSLTFAPIAVGSCTNASSTLVSNTGSSNLTLSSDNITGTNASDFIYGGIGTCNFGSQVVLAPGASCSISIKSCPSATGTRNANIALVNDASGTTNIPLTGTGGAPVATVAPSSGSCGSVQVGASSTCQVFTLTNTGNIDLTNIVVGIQ